MNTIVRLPVENSKDPISHLFNELDHMLAFDGEKEEIGIRLSNEVLEHFEGISGKNYKSHINSVLLHYCILKTRYWLEEVVYGDSYHYWSGGTWTIHETTEPLIHQIFCTVEQTKPEKKGTKFRKIPLSKNVVSHFKGYCESQSYLCDMMRYTTRINGVLAYYVRRYKKMGNVPFSRRHALHLHDLHQKKKLRSYLKKNPFHHYWLKDIPAHLESW